MRDVDGPELLAHLEAADLVVGFNNLRFDYAVLRGYTDGDLRRLPTFDMLEDVRRRIGFRLPLGHLGEETLGVAKSADGLQSLAWWQAGEVARVEAYCRDDVALLRDLLAYGIEHGHLRFRTRDGQRVRLPAPWDLAELIEHATAQSDQSRYPGGRPVSPEPETRTIAPAPG